MNTTHPVNVEFRAAAVLELNSIECITQAHCQSLTLGLQMEIKNILHSYENATLWCSKPGCGICFALTRYGIHFRFFFIMINLLNAS